jgi:hypothetical protein
LSSHCKLQAGRLAAGVIFSEGTNLVQPDVCRVVKIGAILNVIFLSTYNHKPDDSISGAFGDDNRYFHDRAGGISIVVTLRVTDKDATAGVR